MPNENAPCGVVHLFKDLGTPLQKVKIVQTVYIPL